MTKDDYDKLFVAIETAIIEHCNNANTAYDVFVDTDRTGNRFKLFEGDGNNGYYLTISMASEKNKLVF